MQRWCRYLLRWRDTVDPVDAMAAEADDGGPLINGRPAMTVLQVQQWFQKAHAPILSDDAAAEIARFLNEALFLEGLWKPKFAAEQRANPSTKRMERIARALATLRNDLPEVLAESRKIRPDADHSATESLLDFVNRHKAIIDSFPAKRRGRPHNLAINLQTNLQRKIKELAGCEHPIAKQALDAVACDAMEWLRAGPRNDKAISKSRRRRTK
jgi:hypothetical protein